MTTCLGLLAGATVSFGSQIMLREPSISADGREIAFIANGDVFLVPVDGGTASRVVDDPVHASRPRFSPSGHRLLFTSERSGGGDLYVVDLETSAERRLTYHDAADEAEDWSPDGDLVYFSSPRGDIGGYSDLFAVPASGGTPFPVSRARYEGEYDANVSPDGAWIAFNSNDRVRQWYRLGPRRDDATEVWVTPSLPAESSRYDRVTTFEGKDSWPLWAPDGAGVYVVTDEYGSAGGENLAYQELGGKRRQVTFFDGGRVSWPTISASGKLAFERDYGIWTVEEGEEPRRLEIELAARDLETEPVRQERITRISELSPRSTGGLVTVVIHGDVFLLDPDDGSLRRLTRTPGPEQGARLSPDGRTVAYVALRDGYFDIFAYDLARDLETRLTTSAATERELRFDPEGRRLAFVEGVSRIRAIDLDQGTIVDLASGWMMDAEIAWSPDGRSMAYMAADENWISNVWLVSAVDESQPVQLTDFPDVNFNALTWLPDGDSLLVSTWTTREARQVARIRLPEPSPAARVGGGVGELGRGRVDLLLPGSESLVLEAVSRDGQTVLLSGRAAGRHGLWRARLGSRDLEEITLVAEGRITSVAVGGDGSLLYLSGAALHRLPAEASEPIDLELEARFEIDPTSHRVARFREAWLVFRDWLGLGTTACAEWEAAYERHLPFVRGARNDSDFMTVMRMMLGELDVSHVNVWGDPRIDAEPVGNLGLDFDARALRSGRFVVSSIVPSAAMEDGVVRVGDEIMSIGGTRLGLGVNLHALLVGRVGESVAASVRRGAGSFQARLELRSSDDVAEDRYRAWVAANRALVDELSHGRFAYVHRRHFGSGATEALRRELGASALLKDGVVLDIRYNGGGIESARAIGFLRRKVVHRNAFGQHASAPGALVHGIPVLDRPVVLVQNEQVLSDAENFSHQFRELGVGLVVGTRTAAWNRGESGYSLFDGTRASVGAWRALTADGEDMEHRGREPDVFVDRPLGETLTGHDSQLAAAVAALEEWIRSRPTTD